MAELKENSGKYQRQARKKKNEENERWNSQEGRME